MKTERNTVEIHIRSLILPVYIPTLLIMFGYGMIIPVLPLFARSLGAGLGITGVIVSMRGAGSLLFDLPAGAIISRVGKLPALVLASAAAVIAAVATGFIGRLVPLALLTVAMGAVHVLWVLSIQTHLRQNLPSHRRGRAMSLVGGTSRAGWVIGPIVGGYIGKLFGLQVVYFGQAILCFAALIVLLIGSVHYRSWTIERKGESFRAPGIPFLRTVQGNWRAFLLTGLVVITLQLLRSGRQTLLPLWGERIGLDVAAIGLIFGLSRAVELFLFYPAGVLMDRLGRKWTTVPCILLLSLGLALIPTTGGFLGLLMVSMIAGIGNGLGSGIVLTLGADLSPRRSTGEFLGMWHLMGDVGTMSGPLLIGAVAQALGLQVAPLLIAGFGLVGAWLMIFRVAETLNRDKRTDT
ncbi:MAG: MFS transporter [Spirochaetia bacterium]